MACHGGQVSKVQVTDMRDNTFYARVFFCNDKMEEVDSIDARPSDAINLAVRFGVCARRSHPLCVTVTPSTLLSRACVHSFT